MPRDTRDAGYEAEVPWSRLVLGLCLLGFVLGLCLATAKPRPDPSFVSYCMARPKTNADGSFELANGEPCRSVFHRDDI